MPIWGTRKADRVAEALLRRIAGGVLAPGGLLPREEELTSEFGVNRSVVREALKQLEAHRLVQPVKRRGTVVLDPLDSPSPDVLRAMLEPRPGALDRAVLADLLEVRATLDEEMTALAAERRDDGDLAALEAIVARLEGALGEPERYAAIMDDFTLALARATKNRIYQILVRWHHRVRGEVPPLGLVIQLANEPHLSGVRFLLELIREKRSDDARAFVSAVHTWSTPRALAGAALASGVPLDALETKP
jgi:DNA-binding FadR family transcriptional regulator